MTPGQRLYNHLHIIGTMRNRMFRSTAVMINKRAATRGLLRDGSLCLSVGAVRSVGRTSTEPPILSAGAKVRKLFSYNQIFRGEILKLAKNGTKKAKYE